MPPGWEDGTWPGNEVDWGPGSCDTMESSHARLGHLLSGSFYMREKQMSIFNHSYLEVFCCMHPNFILNNVLSL